MKDKKLVILISIIVVTLGLLSLTFYLLLNDKDGKDTNKRDLVAYGVVVEKGSNYLLIEGVDDEKYYVATSNEDIDTGTFVSVTYASKEDKEAGKGIIEIVLNDNEVTIVEDLTTKSVQSYDEVEKATTTTIKTQKTTTTMTTAKKTSATQYRYTTTISEDEIVSYASTTYSDVKDNKKTLESAKEAFIKLVDFIFYDGEIKGRKFNELTSSAKAKVIYYTLLIDTSIDSKWPNYKENIQSKYHDVKDKLIAKYMDLTTSLCESNNDACVQAKNDFKLLKESVKITWNTLKTAFSYAYDKGKTSLVEWYEVFSGKR